MVDRKSSDKGQNHRAADSSLSERHDKVQRENQISEKVVLKLSVSNIISLHSLRVYPVSFTTATDGCRHPQRIHCEISSFATIPRTHRRRYRHHTPRARKRCLNKTKSMTATHHTAPNTNKSAYRTTDDGTTERRSARATTKDNEQPHHTTPHHTTPHHTTPHHTTPVRCLCLA